MKKIRNKLFLALLVIVFFTAIAIGLFGLSFCSEEVSAEEKISCGIDGALEKDGVRLSSLSDEECLNFILNAGVSIPEEFIGRSDLGEFVKNIIYAVEANPEMDIPFNYFVTYEFALNIKEIVNTYYTHNSTFMLESETQGCSVYKLKDSVLEEIPDNVKKYNCYAYATRRCEQPAVYFIKCLDNNKVYPQYQPGSFTNTISSKSLNLDNIIDKVRDDLKVLNFTNITVSRECPAFNTFQNLICVRNGGYDYHFMRYNDGYWYHKPGETAILKYKYQPSEDRKWSNENVDEHGTTHFPLLYYDSEIYYIGYDDPLFDYNEFDDRVEITGFKEGSKITGKIEIPEYIERKPVTSLTNLIFTNQVAITEVVLPNWVNEIRDSYFENCTSLEKVTISENIENIGKNAFKGCIRLSSIGEGDLSSVKTIGEKAFSGCTRLSSTINLNAVEVIGEEAFSGCSNLRVLNYTLKLKVIGKRAFYNCSNFNTLYSFENVESIGDEAFYNCDLYSLNSGSKIKTIGAKAFYHNRGLFVNAHLSSLESIGEEAFLYRRCGFLRVRTIKKSVWIKSYRKHRGKSIFRVRGINRNFGFGDTKNSRKRGV